LIGFGMGTFIFGLMTWGILGEAPNAKVMVSLALALIIILIQMTNVVK
jgi:hypothetical protein